MALELLVRAPVHLNAGPPVLPGPRDHRLSVRRKAEKVAVATQHGAILEPIRIVETLQQLLFAGEQRTEVAHRRSLLTLAQLAQARRQTSSVGFVLAQREFAQPRQRDEQHDDSHGGQHSGVGPVQATGPSARRSPR